MSGRSRGSGGISERSVSRSSGRVPASDLKHADGPWGAFPSWPPREPYPA